MTTLTGIGLHTGIDTRVKILPAEKGSGRIFVRVDLPNAPKIPAHISAVGETTLSTQLCGDREDAKLRTVEHLLAALSAWGVADATIEVDGPEIPLLDGSAAMWVAALAENGWQQQTLQGTWELTEPIVVRQGDAFVSAIPSQILHFTYGIDFDLAPIGNQWYSWHPERESFSEAIAPARTFGFANQIEQLRQAGLIKGGSLDNALVCDVDRWINPPLRFPNEPVRHKLLDLIGDLSLVGSWPKAHFLAYKASHHLHVRLAKRLWELQVPMLSPQL
jgi:UDP-3-O-[3-hydroxymyristoyl] N-acetylglucosamine deacetylase